MRSDYFSLKSFSFLMYCNKYASQGLLRMHGNVEMNCLCNIQGHVGLSNVSRINIQSVYDK